MNIQDYREGNTVWIARLSNGEEVVRYEVDPTINPWEQLRQRVKAEGLTITSLGLAFRSHHEFLPPNKDGYMFCKGVLASVTKNFDLLSIGYLENGKVYLRQYISPELIVWEEFSIDQSECRTLIINPCTGR